MSVALLEAWSEDARNFFCRKCSFVYTTYNVARALTRYELKQLSELEVFLVAVTSSLSLFYVCGEFTV